MVNILTRVCSLKTGSGGWGWDYRSQVADLLQGNLETDFLVPLCPKSNLHAQGEPSADVTSEHSQTIVEPEENHVQISGS
jgi:hypothetical protein